jgi:hypothetical protein
MDRLSQTFEKRQSMPRVSPRAEKRIVPFTIQVPTTSIVAVHEVHAWHPETAHLI